MNNPEEEFLTIAEAAGKFRVSEEAIRRWIRAGLIPYTAVGPFKMKRLRASDLTGKKENDANGKGTVSSGLSGREERGAGRDEEGPGRAPTNSSS